MNTIRLTKQFDFEMAHALWDYDGSCKNVHGHSYRLFVTVSGKPSNKTGDPKLGMVMDFADLKSLVHEHIIRELDHALLINQQAPVDQLRSLKQMFDKMKVVDFQPTCENMVLHFVTVLEPLIPDHLRLFSVKLYETATSYAEWIVTDNE